MPMDTARACWEVTAGVIPGTPEPEYTRRFPLTSQQWDGGSNEGVDAFQAAQGMAMVYALTLMHPAKLNWVRLDWIWY